jgi:hypothetical protein
MGGKRPPKKGEGKKRYHFALGSVTFQKTSQSLAPSVLAASSSARSWASCFFVVVVEVF